MELSFQTSSQEDSHANRSQSQANKKEQVTTDISGQRCFASSRHSNLGSLLARMCQELLTSKTAWSSKLCALTWKVKDTKFNRSIFQLQPSVLRIKEKEYGSLLPTPTTQEIEHPNMKTNEDRQKINEGRQRQSQFESSGYSENVENSNDNGLEGRLSKTRNQVSSRQEYTINGIENTNLSSRRSDGGADQTEPRINGEVQRLRDGNEEESSRTTGVRGLHERTNDSSSSIREDRNQEDNNRTLVQKRQGGVQSSIRGGLGTDQTSLEDNQIRQGDDNTTLNRMERRHEDMENSRRTLQQGTELREKNEDEVREGYANQHQRSGSSSESNVANTRSERLEGQLRSKLQGTRERFTNSSERSREDVADTERKGLEGLNKQSTTISGKDERIYTWNENSRDQANSTEHQNWWQSEPDVGRVAHGIPGRVHRLKGLGNSIIPQIAEEIGKAIIKAKEVNEV